MEIIKENASALRDLQFQIIQDAPNVTNVLWTHFDNNGYSRTISFEVNDSVFEIDWSWNESKLYFDHGSFLRFNKCQVEGTWPNGYKTNLQFYLNKEVVAVIPIESY